MALIEKKFRFTGWLLPAMILIITGCNRLPSPPITNPSNTPWISPTSSPSHTPSPTVTATQTSSPTFTPEPTLTNTLRPTATSTPTITSTSTLAVPSLMVNQQAHCRYGPGKAYLHAADLYEGDFAVIDGKSASGSWLWIMPEDIQYHCWVSKSVVDVQGDLVDVPVVATILPMSVANLYKPPESVWAERKKDQVIIFWSDVWMTVDDDRGYLIEAYVCQNSARVFIALWTEKNKMEITDENKGCSGSSSGKLYAVEKHGYLEPLEIPWP